MKSEPHASHCCAGPGYATVEDAIKAPREKLLYVIGVHTGTETKAPDFLATIDADPASPTYSKVIHKLSMPNIGDELHHFGWNACSSCHDDPSKSRRFLVLPGLGSSRIHIVDTQNARAPKIRKVIEPQEIAQKVNLSTPHTVHCLADGHVMISMLGDAKGEGPGGFLLLKGEDFSIAGRWEKKSEGMKYNYDYWYQPRHNVMVSSEWAAPNTFKQGFDLKDVEAGKYGQRIHFWDWKNRTLEQTFDLGGEGLVPLEVRFHHDPASTHGYVGAALSSAIWHWNKPNGQWKVDKVVQVEPVEHEGWPFPVPGLISDVILSLDDRFLYFANWLHGDLRQYDLSDPGKPKLTGQLWLGGVLGRKPERELPPGGPQMLQLSLDGKRLYVTSSLFSVWDNQFYPAMAKEGSYLLQIDCDPTGGMSLNKDFYVDFGKMEGGPARAHEVRYPGGDCTSDIWL